MHKYFCHLEASSRCALVSIAPAGCLIRVREAKTDAVRGVDNKTFQFLKRAG